MTTNDYPPAYMEKIQVYKFSWITFLTHAAVFFALWFVVWRIALAFYTKPHDSSAYTQTMFISIGIVGMIILIYNCGVCCLFFSDELREINPNILPLMDWLHYASHIKNAKKDFEEASKTFYDPDAFHGEAEAAKRAMDACEVFIRNYEKKVDEQAELRLKTAFLCVYGKRVDKAVDHEMGLPPPPYAQREENVPLDVSSLTPPPYARKEETGTLNNNKSSIFQKKNVYNI